MARKSKLSLIPLLYYFICIIPLTNCNNIPLPNVTRQLDISLCGSYCPYKSRGHTAEIGDSCDPQLFQSLRREYDDRDDTMDQERKIFKILGTAITHKRPDKPDWRWKEKELKYTGDCTHYCPEMMCMSVIAAPFEFDQYKLDCIEIDKGNPYKGVCTCGYLFSQVDPLNLNKSRVDDLQATTYASMIGLNRRLVWDEKNQRCSADHFGHCSLHWENKVPGEQQTYCYYPEDECTNQSFVSRGEHIRSFRRQVKPHDDLWYGICDRKGRAPSPRAETDAAISSRGSVGLMLLLVTIYLTVMGAGEE